MLNVYRAERADRLVEALGDLLVIPLADAMRAEVISVPTRGIERWLIQRLAMRLGAASGREDGICGNVDFPFPARMLEGSTRAALGAPEDEDPWRPERAVWPLVALVDAALGEPWLAPLAASMCTPGRDETDRDARFAAVRRVADRFDRYAVHRPWMLRDWAEGLDVDASGDPLPDDLAWQAELWRRLRAAVGESSPPERLAEACDRLRADPGATALPERVSIFGLTRLPPVHLEILDALAVHREVHLFLLHPSPVLWDEVAALRPPARRVRREDDPTADAPRHPLLASWGRDAREMQLSLAGDAAVAAEVIEGAPETLLGHIQADIRANREPPGPPVGDANDRRMLLAEKDHSLQIHSCHGRARQVEVLRDAVLHLLAADESLEPRDIIVMCPDIEAFAPLIHATFGAPAIAPDVGGDTPSRVPDLRVRLADRSLRQTNPLLGVLAELLRLASARITASEVLDLAARAPVRRRFALDDDGLTRLEEWADVSGIRWGLDQHGRADFGLEDVRENTWAAGLDRILLGVAMSEEDERLVGGVLPLGDVEPGEVGLAGRAAELVDRLGTALAGLRGTRTVAGWAAVLAGALDLLTEPPPHERWQREQADELLAGVVEEAAGSTVELTCAEIRSLLDDRLRGRPTRASFRTGHLTACTLVPMRSVPHRVVCLLGLDDDTFPRRAVPDGDDIVARDPYVGDPDRRGEDRQLLLDALMAATEHLVITYAGRDERTNATSPPAVPVGELLDVVDATARLDDDRRGREHVLTRHPLQPFDPRNFAPAGDARRFAPAAPWGFDPVALEGARALGGPRTAAEFLADPLPPLEDETIGLDELVRFVQHPVQQFLRRRLQVWLGDAADEPNDAIPLELDNLQQWGVGDRLLAARRRGADPEAALAAERARGLLPPRGLADAVLEPIAQEVEALLAAVHESCGAGAPRSEAVDVALPSGTRIVGTVGGVVGDVVLSADYSRLAAKHRLAAWVRLLALSAADPDRPWSAIAIGRAPSKSSKVVRISTLPPLGEDPQGRRARASSLLEDLVALHRRGMREPLPLYCKTSAAYAGAVHEGKDAVRAVKAAEGEWKSGGYPKEDADGSHLLVLGEATVDDLLVEAPREDERGAGWCDDEDHRLGRYARRLWDPILAHEEVGDR